MPVDAPVPPLGPTQRLQALPKSRRARLAFRIVLRIVHQHCDPAHPVRLLRACREWPRRRAAQAANEISTIERTARHVFPRLAGRHPPTLSPKLVPVLITQAGASPWDDPEMF